MKNKKYYTALLCLLVYAYKYNWVRDKIEKENIDVLKYFQNNCTEEEIEDYINVLKEEEKNKEAMV